MITITTKYLGPTNTQGSRIKVSHGNKDYFPSKSYSYDHSSNDPHITAFKQYCADMAKLYPDSFFANQQDWIIGDTSTGIVAVMANDRHVTTNGINTVFSSIDGK